MNNKFLVGALVILMLLVSGLYFKGGSNLLGGGTRMVNGISTDTTSPSAGEVRTTTLTVTSTSALSGALTAAAATLSGLLTTNAGTLNSYTLATSSTATAQTLKQSDILSYDTILFTSNTGADTITFPATSTLTSFVPTAGDMAEQCWYNATTTTGASGTIIFAAGTGFDLEVATSTVQSGAFDLTLSGGNMACFKFLRKTNTDIVAGFLEYSDAD